jgi:hypothetical protein
MSTPHLKVHLLEKTTASLEEKEKTRKRRQLILQKKIENTKSAGSLFSFFY